MLIMYQEHGKWPTLSEVVDLEAFDDENGKIRAIFSGPDVLDIIVTNISHSNYYSILDELFENGKVNLNQYSVDVKLRRDDDYISIASGCPAPAPTQEKT